MSLKKGEGEIFAFGNDAQNSLPSVCASWIGAKYCSFPFGPLLSQVIFTKAFSTMYDMLPSDGEVDHSCPCEGFITQPFRAPPSSHDIVARRHSLCFLGRRESLCGCRGTPRSFSLNWHFLRWAGVRIYCFCTLSRWICLGVIFLVI